MGLLSNALLAGAGQGLQTLGGYMYKSVEKEQDESLAVRRAKMLAELQRESAKNLRNDEQAFRNAPENVAADIATATQKAEAAGKVSRGQKVAELTDPDLISATATQKERDSADELRRETARAESLGRTKNKLDMDSAQEKVGNKVYMAAVRALQAAQQGPDRTDYKGRKLENEMRELQVESAKYLAGLKKEYKTADPKRQSAISEEISVLTGKDTDKYVPLPVKDAEGNTIGFKIFDAKRGAMREDAEQGDESKIRAGVAEARKAGKAAEAAVSLKARGASDDQLRELFTPEELALAGGKVKEKPKKNMLSSTGRPREEVPMSGPAM